MSDLFSHPSDNQKDSSSFVLDESSSLIPSAVEASKLPPNKRTVTAKKRHGVFYTPDPASRLLTKWAIRSAADRVLEPSFGGCGFLQAAKDRLTALEVGAPEQPISIIVVKRGPVCRIRHGAF